MRDTRRRSPRPANEEWISPRCEGSRPAVNLKARAPFAAALLGVLLLVVLDGWVPLRPGAPATASVPPALVEAVGRAAQDLSSRAEALSRKPEVERSLQGGGIAVNRLVLFSAARQTMEGAAPTNWIALADPLGAVHAWWGDAPASLAGLVSADGFGARWSATALTLLYRRSIGDGGSAGIVYSARSFPVEAPDFGRALDLSGESLSWEPLARTRLCRHPPHRAVPGRARPQSGPGRRRAGARVPRNPGARGFSRLFLRAPPAPRRRSPAAAIPAGASLGRIADPLPAVSIGFGLRSGSSRSGGGHEHHGPGAGKPAALLLTRPVGGAVGPGDRYPGPDVFRAARRLGKADDGGASFHGARDRFRPGLRQSFTLLSRRSGAPLRRRVRALVACGRGHSADARSRRPPAADGRGPPSQDR